MARALKVEGHIAPVVVCGIGGHLASLFSTKIRVKGNL